jgi:transposase
MATGPAAAGLQHHRLDRRLTGHPPEGALPLSDHAADFAAADAAGGPVLEAPALCVRHQGAAPRAEKRAIVRRLQQVPPRAVLLFMDETILRLFPPLRACWALRGQQAIVPITGRNAKRVLFGALNPHTGHRILLRRHRMRQQDFQEFLRLLRRRYRGRQIWLLLDEAPCHTAATSQALAAQLDIVLIWLPTRCSELNAIDHLWKELKGRMAANRQFPTIEKGTESAEQWVCGLSHRQALRKAGVLSKSYWLKNFSKNFWPPT